MHTSFMSCAAIASSSSTSGSSAADAADASFFFLGSFFFGVAGFGGIPERGAARRFDFKDVVFSLAVRSADKSGEDDNGGGRRGRGGGRPAPTPLPSRTISNRSAQCSAQGTRHAPCGRTDHPTIRVAVPTGQRLRIDVTLKHPPPRTYVRTVIVGLRENRDLEGTHRFS